MKVTIALGLLALAGATLAGPQYGYNHPGPVYSAPAPAYRPAPAYKPQPSYNAIPRYDFDYAVKDYNGNDFGHQESRDGYNTKGSYYVQLPDGRRQHVRYYVDGDSGYVAEVSYEGVAKYPATYGHGPSYGPGPSYGHAPVPAYKPVPAYG